MIKAVYLVLLACIAIILGYSLWHSSVLDEVQLIFTTQPGLGVFISFLVTTLLVMLCVPYALMAAVIGFMLFQATKNVEKTVVLGTLAVWTGANLGAAIAFPIGRYLVRSEVARYAERTDAFKAFMKLFERSGLKLMVLIRLSIFTPFSLSNYVLGSTGVNYKHYLTGNLFILPECILYVYTGCSAETMQEAIAGKSSNAKTGLMICSILIAFGLVLWVSVEVKKIMKKELRKFDLAGQRDSIGSLTELQTP